MSGYDRGYGRRIDRSSYDYQYGANPEAYSRGGYRGVLPGRSFIGDEVGSYGSEFGSIGRNFTAREYGGGGFGAGRQGRGYDRGASGGYEGSFGGSYGEGFGGGRPRRAFGQGYDRGYGRERFSQGGFGQGGYGRGGYGQDGFGGGTFIGAEGGASAGYGRDADNLAGYEERFTHQARGSGFLAGRGYDAGYGRGAFGQDYEAGSYGGLPPAGRGFGGYGADYGADMGSYDVDYGGAFMGGVPGYSGGYDAGYGDFGARSGGMTLGYDRGFGGGGARGYDRGRGGGFAQGPFMPEEAYRRHPEYDQPPHRRGMDTGGYGYTDTVDEDLSDEQVLHGVRSRLQQDRWVDAGQINVEVEAGVVTLTGEVGDFMEARYAWDDAWETPGVHGVVNSLTVRTDLPHEPHGDVVPQSGGGDS
jgi:hypothetical protein